MGCKCSKRLARYVSAPGPAPKSSEGQDDDLPTDESQVVSSIDVNEFEAEGENEEPKQEEKPDPHACRRAEEVEAIRQHDTAEADIFYLIDLNWLAEWRNFAFKDGPLPGPIDNSRLVDPETGKPKSGLLLKDDYRGVNEALWNFWHERYGGGPAVQRQCLDLYAPDPADAPPAPREEKVASPEDLKREAIAQSFAHAMDAMKEFPLKLSFTAPKPAVMASKGLADLMPILMTAPHGSAPIFDSSTNANDFLDTRQFPDNTVFVNIYNLGSDGLGGMINKISTMNDVAMVGGVFHAGIEVYGNEWTFGKTIEEVSGVWRTLPRMEMGHQYRATVPLGSTPLANVQVWELMRRLGKEWLGTSYDLLRRNCLSFSNTLCDELGVRRIPRWVDRAPRAASAVMDTTAILGCTGRNK